MGYREVRALAQLLYHGLTTGLGLQTLGEEYCSMLQVTGNLETSTHKLHELVQALSEQLHSCTRMRFYKHAFVHTRITSTKHAHTHACIYAQALHVQLLTPTHGVHVLVIKNSVQTRAGDGGIPSLSRRTALVLLHSLVRH